MKKLLIPTQHVTLENLKENFEKAFYTCSLEDDSIIINQPFDKLIISIARKDCVQIETRYTINNFLFEKYSQALEKANEVNDKYLGIRLRIGFLDNTLILSFLYDMFFDQELDFKQLIINSAFVDRVSKESLVDSFQDINS